MANNPKISNALASVAADAACAEMDDGFLRIYDGAQPAGPDTAITTQVLLAELTLDNPAFAAAVNGIALANTIGSETNAPASGTASWFRIFATDGTTALLDGSVGTSGCDLNLAVTAITATGTVSVSAFTYTQSKS